MSTSTTTPPSSSSHGVGGEEQRETGEQSVERFGSEAASGERAAILAAKRGYLEALAAEDYAAACDHLSERVRVSLRQLVAQQLKAKGCRAILPILLAKSAAATAAAQAAGKVTKVRVEGDQAFIVFRAPGAKLYVFTLLKVGDEWKATTVASSILVPDLG